MSSGDGSVAVSARPALPTTCQTSGNVRMIASRALRSSVASVMLVRGTDVGISRIEPLVEMGHELAAQLRRGNVTEADDHAERPDHHPGRSRSQASIGLKTPIIVRTSQFSSSDLIRPLRKIGIKAGTSVIERIATPIRANVLV